MSSNSSSATGIMSAPASTKSAPKRVAKKTEDVATPVAAVVATPVAPVAAPVAKAPKAKAAKATATPSATPVEAPVSTPAVATPVAADASAAVVEEVRLEAEVKDITARLLSVREAVSSLITESKKLEKRAAKLQKLADKRKRKVKAVAEDGKPAKVSMFKIPLGISPALCSFLGLAPGSKESRANVATFIGKYVRDHKLKDAKHGINPDAALKKLLNLKEGDALTYFNLQKYLNVHYTKAEKPAAVATA